MVFLLIIFDKFQVAKNKENLLPAKVRSTKTNAFPFLIPEQKQIEQLKY